MLFLLLRGGYFRGRLASLRMFGAFGLTGIIKFLKGEKFVKEFWEVVRLISEFSLSG